MTAKNNYELKKAVKIGSLCIVSYLSSYLMRNILSVSTPQMVESGNFTKEFLGYISSVYFILYACGQLVNGVIGDKIKGKYMVSIGLVVSACAMTVFPLVGTSFVQIMCFAVNGFALSMLRGPLVRIISENTIPKYARNCCVGFSVASFAGPLIAGVMASALNWKWVFFSASFVTFLMGICVFIILTIFERKGIVSQNEDAVKVHSGTLRGLFNVFYIDKFVLYLFVAGLTEIVSSSVAFWIPSYISENLGFSAQTSSILYSVISVIKAMSPFLCIYLFTLLHERESFFMTMMYIVSSCGFVAMSLISNIWVNIFVLLIALVGSGCVSNIVWSVYIPSLNESRCVSTANGVLDFSGYMFAAVANIVFSNAVAVIGWKGLTFVWGAMMLSGAAMIVIYNTKIRKCKD